jgi:hypothetical protein
MSQTKIIRCMIFGVATNEDRRQRSDNQSKEDTSCLGFILLRKR